MTIIRKISVLFLFLLINSSGLWAQVLRGKVTDTRGAPLSYASVYISELRQGTATNVEGEYEIRLPEGTFSVSYQYLGFMPVLERVTISGGDIQKNIILTEQVFMIPEVRVSASGKDPAWYVMRKAIGMAPFHLNQVRRYKAEVYIKGGGRIDRLPKIVQRQMKAEANQAEIKEGQYYFTESMNIITFTAPDKYVHQVISSRSNIPAEEAQTSPMDYLEASFYQPVLVDIAISPLAPNAFGHYDFKYMGATLQGDYMIDKIKVTPKRKSQQLFEGFIYIVEDQWAIHSLDLTNENMAGTVRIKQLYTPVESGIWMPVSHEFLMNISMIGIKATASYSSAVKYLEVEPDRSLTPPKGYQVTTAAAPEPQVKTEKQKEIEKIFSKSELTARDMAKLSRLNEKNASASKPDTTLEIRDKVTYIVEKDASARDSAYWEEVRPIPLTREEIISLPVMRRDTASLSTKPDSTTLTLSIGSPSKNHTSMVVGDILKGKRWQTSKNTWVSFDGLLNLKTFSFNTVDGFALGTGMSVSTRTGEKGRLSFYPSARYAFSRKSLMWNTSINMMYNPATSGSFFLRAGMGSKEFSQSGVNPFVNTVSSLMFRQNWMKLYNSTYFIAGHRSDIANGLHMTLTGTWEKRGVLENTTDFAFFNTDRSYSANLPDNPFVLGEVPDHEAMMPVNHHNVTVSIDIYYIPQNRYRINNGTKINLGSDYPTFKLYWKHGYNYNDTLSGHFDLIRAEISENIHYGAMSQFRWRILGGGFINSKNLQLQDHYYFNTQATPVLLNNYQDAFFLRQYYSISTPSWFAESHVAYTTPYLLLKRLPGLSRTLMRENLSLSALWTPEYSFYTQLGYSISEVFLLAEVGVYTAFRDLTFDGVGVRLALRLR